MKLNPRHPCDPVNSRPSQTHACLREQLNKCVAELLTITHILSMTSQRLQSAVKRLSILLFLIFCLLACQSRSVCLSVSVCFFLSVCLHVSLCLSDHLLTWSLSLSVCLSVCVCLVGEDKKVKTG